MDTPARAWIFGGGVGYRLLRMGVGVGSRARAVSPMIWRKCRVIVIMLSCRCNDINDLAPIAHDSRVIAGLDHNMWCLLDCARRKPNSVK